LKTKNKNEHRITYLKRIGVFFFCWCSLAFAQEKSIQDSVEIDTLFLELQQDLNTAITDSLQIKTLSELGLYLIDKDLVKAEDYLNQALAILVNGPPYNYQQQLGVIYDHLGVLRRRQADYSESISYYLKAKEIFEHTKDSIHLASVLHNMGVAYRFLEDFPKSIQYLKEALKIKTSLNDRKEEALTRNMLGVSFRRNKQLDSALFHYQKAEQLFRTAGSKNDVKQVKGNIATLLYVQKKYTRSLALYLDVLKDNKEEGDKIATARTYNSLGRNYRKLEQNYLALKYLDSSLELAKEMGLKNRIALAHRSKANAFRALGDFESAYFSYVQYKRYNDSLMNKESIEQIRELELRYEFRKEKLQDSLQLERERALAETNIQLLKSRNRTQTLWIIFGGLGLVGIFSIIYLTRSRYFYQNKQKLQTEFTQDLISERELERKRLSRDLHDGVGQKLMLLTKKVKGLQDTELSSLASNTLEELRTISRGLHPASLEQLGFSAAVTALINEVDAHSNIFFTHEITNVDDVLPKKTTVHLYRMVQEILSNMVKHAQAGEAVITIRSQEKTISITIADNGIGFDFQKELRESESIGLRTLLEHSHIVGGTFHVSSDSDKGTLITINVPLQYD